MSSSRRPGRRVPSKGRALRSDPVPPPPGDEATTTERATRAQNRAAKRAAGGVRPKTGGRVRAGGAARASNMGLIVLAVLAVAVGAAVIVLGNPFGTPTPSASPGPTTSGVVGDGSCPTAQPVPLAAGEKRTVTITTSLGKIVLEIDGSLSPIAAGNFVALVTCHFYDGSVFHRTAALQDGTPFVIQGGAARAGTSPIGYAIADEPVTTIYQRGTLAMARTSQPNSQTSQFFIVLDDGAEPALRTANTYAIFGKVIDGMTVADAIFKASAGVELPASPIAMTAVTVSAGPSASASPAPTATPTAAPSGSVPSPTPAPTIP